MNKTRITIFIITLGMVAVLVGCSLIPGQSQGESLPETASPHGTSLDLGITYLQVTPSSSAYYGTTVESGALVTEVAPDSLAWRAGIRKGDVIINFNGARLEKGTPLLGMMMACPADNTVKLEVWREGNLSTIEFFHGSR